MKLYCQALIQGLLLPIRMYFQPLTVLRKAAALNTPDDSAPSMGLVYVFSLLWLPIGIITGLIVFGPPRENAFTMLVVIPSLLALVGAFMGRSPLQVQREGRPVKQIFNYPLPVAFGVILGLTALFNAFTLEMLSKQHDIGIAQVVDSRTLDVPAAVILGAGGALSLSLALGSTLGPRRIALYGSLFAAAALTVPIINNNLRPDNLAAFIPLFLLIGHLGLQPLYLIAGLASLLLAGIAPDRSPAVWRLSPAAWCEYAYVPLPGLAWLLRTVYHADPTAGKQAVDQVMLHPFYYQIAQGIARELDVSGNGRGRSL